MASCKKNKKKVDAFIITGNLESSSFLWHIEKVGFYSTVALNI